MRPPKRIHQRQLELRARLWPGLKSGDLWSRHTHDGFSTIPSTMPLVLLIVDDLSNGRPAPMTYLDLWTRAFDEGFVTLAKPREMAFHSGFTTQRAERTWRQKLDVLAELGFIDLKSGPNGPASYALLWNSLPRDQAASRGKERRTARGQVQCARCARSGNRRSHLCAVRTRSIAGDYNATPWLLRRADPVAEKEDEIDRDVTSR